MSAGTPAPQWPSVWDFGLAPLPQAIAFAGAVRSLTEAVLSLDAPSDRLDDLIEKIQCRFCIAGFFIFERRRVEKKRVAGRFLQHLPQLFQT